MTWRIEVKPTSHALEAWTWTAERSDNDTILMFDNVLSTKEDALADAKAAVGAWEDRQAIINSNSVVIQAYSPGAP